MIDQQANADKGADPGDEIKKQNPGETATGDLATRKATRLPTATTPRRSQAYRTANIAMQANEKCKL